MEARTRENAGTAKIMEPIHVPGADPSRGGDAGSGGRTTVRLSVLQTGKLVEATFQFDKQGRVVGMNPVLPLDPQTEYRVGPAL